MLPTLRQVWLLYDLFVQTVRQYKEQDRAKQVVDYYFDTFVQLKIFPVKIS